MKKLFLSFIFIWLLFDTGFSQSTNILFDKDSYTINQSAKAKLDSLIKILKKVSAQEELCLVGHTDVDADEIYNKKLSLNRATAIKDYFLLNGISNTIHIESKGEAKPLNASATEFEKTLNRRVEIIQDYIPSNSFFTNHKKEFQQFEIPYNKDTILTCKEGTQISIDSGIFNNAASNLPITIKLQEFRTKSDFILANLTTTDHNENIIESRGMVFIEAYQGTKLLTLKKGRSIGILFKDRQVNDQTELFVGESHNNHISWEQQDMPSRKISTKNFPTTFTETVIYKKKLFIFQGKTKYSKRYWYDSIKGQPYKMIEIYNDGYSKTKRYKIASDTALITEYKIYLAKEKARKDAQMKTEEMNTLLLNCPKLGWINCDRFYNNGKPKINVVIKYEGDFVPNVVLVFKNINSIMPYTLRIDNEIIFENIPEDMAFDIIGLYQENETVLFVQKEAVAKNGNVETIYFIKVSPTELTSYIKNLN